MRFREKMAQFMYGRYGYDQLSFFLLISSLVMMVLSRLLGGIPFLGFVLWLGQILAIAFCLVRVLSRNVYKRQKENAWYLKKSRAFSRWFRSAKDRWQQRKDYKFFRCPSCHSLLRVPKGKGKLLLTCRKCGNRFERKT